jgi:hypothetical protein
VAGEELGGVLKLKAGESEEAGPKREGGEGPSSELTGRGDYGGFGFDSGGADVPPTIRLGQGARGARMGRCMVQLLEERGVGGTLGQWSKNGGVRYWGTSHEAHDRRMAWMRRLRGRGSTGVALPQSQRKRAVVQTVKRV